MTLILRTLDDWTTHQDYVWFLAALAWAAVLTAVLRRRISTGRDRGNWIALWATANFASALVELVLLSIHDHTDKYLVWDRVMSAAGCAASSALCWGALPDRVRAHRPWAPAAGILIAVSLSLAACRT
jgi:hypothetical protein